MARNIVEDFIKNKSLKQTINIQIIGSYYNNLKLFKDSDEYQHLVLLNNLGQTDNLNLKAKEIMASTLKNFAKEYDYSDLEKDFRQGRLELNGFQRKIDDDVETPIRYKKKFKEHMTRYLNRQSWISNLSKIDWKSL